MIYVCKHMNMHTYIYIYFFFIFFFIPVKKIEKIINYMKKANICIYNLAKTGF